MRWVGRRWRGSWWRGGGYESAAQRIKITGGGDNDGKSRMTLD